ncbi:MAG: hypothetical protein HZC40_13560 [Chloroflexi bacterium]|nr:hypothetical protein [Chloroflexota bacterium]
MNQPGSARRLIIAGLFVWLALLSCRTTTLFARAEPTEPPPEPTTRPTFTRVPPTAPPTQAPPPTNPPPPTTRPPTARPTVRPAPTRVPPTPVPAAPAPTVDPYPGFYYKPKPAVCVASGNTRIQGTVTDQGVPRNGVIVRVSYEQNGPPIINDSVTGTDPRDHMHTDPTLQGKYQLGIKEGEQFDGNWWVFIVDSSGNALSPGVHVKTHDGPGCNTATVDFAH